MPASPDIVPMPKWSVPIGCTKFILAIIVLAFIAACTAVWGGFSAFCFSLFTASTSLVVFGYYLTALSFDQRFYNRYVILALETHLTLLWFTSLILLSGWTGASLHLPYFTWRSTVPLFPYGGVVDTQKHGAPSAWHPSAFLRRRTELLTTPVRVHSQEAHRATQILAGLSAGLAGIEFILYGITLVVFIANSIRPASAEDIDVEVNQLPSRTPGQETLLHSPTSQIASRVRSRPTPPRQSTPGAHEAGERETGSSSEPQEWSREAEVAARAGIQPPTPVMKALVAEREMERRRDMGNMALDDTNPLLNVSHDLLLGSSSETRGGGLGEKGTESKRKEIAVNF